MATPKPTPKPGTNVNNRTPKEQMQYDRYEKSKKIGQGDDFTNSPLGKFVGGLFKKTPKTTVAPGPSKAKLAAIAKAKAKKSSASTAEREKMLKSYMGGMKTQPKFTPANTKNAQNK